MNILCILINQCPIYDTVELSEICFFSNDVHEYEIIPHDMYMQIFLHEYMKCRVATGFAKTSDTPKLGQAENRIVKVVPFL